MSNSILSNNELINKFFEENDLDFYYTKTAVKHLKEFVVAASSKGFTAKTTDIAEFSVNHRTTIGHFLSNGVWDEKYIDRIIKKEVTHFMLNQSKNTTQPIFVSTDDTVNKKTKPSSQAKSPIEKAGFHHSHLLGKTVWGHQVLATMIGCMGHTLNYDLQLYDKTAGSKIDYMIELSKSLPIPPNKGYALFDSWFTCPKVLDAYALQGYYCIGAIKTNRIIYPQGIRINISDFSQYIKINDVNLVTVNNSKYWVYRYEGALNDIDNAVVLFSWPKNAFGVSKALKAFICTDVSLDTATILKYYTNRWPIEVFFKQEKVNLGFNKYQIRSIKGIKRIWLLQSLVHLICTIGLNETMKFGEGLRKLRKQTKQNSISWIYQCAKSNIPLDKVLKALKAA
jgi:hypothetical protein